MAHIGAQKFGLSAELAEFSDEFLAFIVVSAGNNDPRSFMREGQGCGTTKVLWECSYNSSIWMWVNDSRVVITFVLDVCFG
jgi:hypothetical protein